MTVPWFRAVSYNVAGYNVQGRKSWGKVRRLGVILTIRRWRADVVAVQELANDYATPDGLTPRDYVDVKLKRFARVHGGSDGRYLYIRRTHTIVDSGRFLLTPEYREDDKQAAWAVVDIHLERTLQVSFHLENEGTGDKVRVGQMRSVITQALEQARAYDIPPSNVFLFGDANDHTAVLAAAKDLGFVDAFTVATKTTRTGISSINGWRPARRGQRADLGLVTKNRPVIYASQRGTRRLADHYAQVFTFGIKEKS